MMKYILAGLLAMIASSAKAQSVVEAIQRPDDIWNVAIPGGLTVSIGTSTTISLSTSATVNVMLQLSAAYATVSVTGGTGNGVLTSTGTALSCGVIPPSDTASYKFSVVTNDADEYPIFGFAKAIVGRAVIRGSFYLVASSKVVIEEASVDGTYKVRCGIQK
jgi:hypothetical protein